jgi:DNA-directed RNA polymerase specialized sigma24 family protein
MGLATLKSPDPADAVAQVAAARRERMLRVHRRRLRREDLEDCYSQATLELIARSRRAPFESREHITNALDQKFASRIEDRRRAISGRSGIEAALARAVSVETREHAGSEVEDPTASVERQVLARAEVHRVRELAEELTADMKLVLACQVSLGMGAQEFCRRFGWSSEKYRKVAQRARLRLRRLLVEYELGERCARLEPDLIAMSAGTAGDEQIARAKAHIANCRACARIVRGLDRSARDVAALLPAPVLGGGGFAWAASVLRRVAGFARHPLAADACGGSAQAGVAGMAGAPALGVGAVKAALAALCIAGAAGGYAACAHLGVVPPLSFWSSPGHTVAPRVAPRRAAPRRPAARKTAVSAAAASHSTVVASAGAVTRRMSDAAQVRLEFSSPPARSSSSGKTTVRSVRVSASAAAVLGGTTHPSSYGITAAAAAASSASPPAVQSAANARQTASEFGFER